MAENTEDLKGDDWFSKLKNPQEQSLNTETAEGLGSPPPPQNVDPQQQ